MQSTFLNEKSFLQIDDTVIYEFSNKLNEETMIKISKTIQSHLISAQVHIDKIDDIFKILIEIMQNILNYSYDKIELKNNKREAQGILIVTMNSIENTCTIQSSNLIKNTKKAIIQERLHEIQGLNEKDLRRLLRQKMRAKKDIHTKGAGLGFIIIGLRVVKPVIITFTPIENDILKYTLLLQL
ncbi:hypothetical protein JHD48_04870 [Sulfurimonas sp. SAG-AH-194-I05]|nr:SiaB family protein kinase [Sulfurimonas sp. SAG-AH-194-I05]MDF1875062.1 hypothetical protein [Sulfurimonas sp. SAG-AH-194-I05]